MNEMHNYSIDKERAIKQMLDMNERAIKNRKQPKSTRTTSDNSPLSFMNIPFDSDTITIIALMYILYKDNCDMLLIFALAYILIWHFSDKPKTAKKSSYKIVTKLMEFFAFLYIM